ncbi:cGMP-dependent protein kinase 2 [Alosa alosa]|uniref:cGMP-dependent protein kinase 2 n=1 Tax=Alosa alosa TaxID=278164 RepID=UPI00201509A5|nr:cGMP-dependent protein kinase 2 [Alosa alosa]
MEAQLEELKRQLEKQCQLTQKLQTEKPEPGQLQELQSEAVPGFRSQRNSVESVSEVRQSRAAVIAPEPLSEHLDIPRVKKTTSEAEQIKHAIQKNDFLSRLDDEQISMMVELLEALDRCPGDDVIVEGSEGDSMYIVAAGELKVTQAGHVLRTLSSGDVFGELAILYNCKRTASVRAATAVRLWSIQRQKYRTIMTNKSIRKREQLMGFLKTAQTLKALNDLQLSKIIDSMEEVKFQKSEVIVREGAEGNTFYIILDGEVLVTKKVNGQQKTIRRMGQGEHFGELALIREILRTATCTALGPVTCFCIDKEVFEETIPIENLELHDELKVLEPSPEPEDVQPGASLRLKDLVPVFYQEGRYQGDPVTLGVGGFGRVALVTTKHSGKYYAVKKVSKKHIVAKRQEGHVLFEKRILQIIQCDFIVKLHAAFKDSRYIYMVMEYCGGGEIWTKLKEVGRFDEPVAVFCTACVVEAFAYLHKKGIMYRDLKPENLLLDERGYIKLVNGQSTHTHTHTHTLTHTHTHITQTHYIFEVTSRTRETATSLPDFWSLGVLVYELLVGSPPFSSSEPQKIYSKILDGVVKFPPHMSEAARSLISKLCRPRPGQRLGNTKNGIKDVRHHRWFSTVNWHKLRMGQVEAPPPRVCVQGPCYINFDRFPHDKTQAEEEFSGWDKDF